MCDLSGMRFKNMSLIDYMCCKNEYSAIAVTPDCKRWGVATERKTQEKANADAIDQCDGRGLGIVGNYQGCKVHYKESNCGMYFTTIIYWLIKFYIEYAVLQRYQKYVMLSKHSACIALVC